MAIGAICSNGLQFECWCYPLNLCAILETFVLNMHTVFPKLTAGKNFLNKGKYQG